VLRTAILKLLLQFLWVKVILEHGLHIRLGELFGSLLNLGGLNDLWGDLAVFAFLSGLASQFTVLHIF
jgi:hypothetical protein